MQSGKLRTETELPSEKERNEAEETESEHPTPPIDEDVSGSVNAAVPDSNDN